jgi:hypothetical protein
MSVKETTMRKTLREKKPVANLEDEVAQVATNFKSLLASYEDPEDRGRFLGRLTVLFGLPVHAPVDDIVAEVTKLFNEELQQSSRRKRRRR